MRATTAIFLAIALLSAPAVHAAPRREDAAAEAARLHTKARQAMRALEFEEALPLLQKAARLPGLPAHTRAELQADLGITHVNLGDTAKARAAFELALEIDPLLELPARTPPKIRQLYEAVRSERAPPAAAPSERPAPSPPLQSAPVDSGPGFSRTLPLVLGGVAVAALATGIFTASSSASAARELGAEPHDRATVDSLRARQQTMGVIAVVSYSLAAVAATTAAGVLLWPRLTEGSPALSGAVSPEGAHVFFTYGF